MFLYLSLCAFACVGLGFARISLRKDLESKDLEIFILTPETPLASSKTDDEITGKRAYLQSNTHYVLMLAGGSSIK